MANKVVINEVTIQVLPKEEQRMVFINNGVMPHFMDWNRAKKQWKFTSDVPEQLIKMESEISSFIEKSSFKYSG